MTPHNCLFQVSLFKGDHLLMSFDWTSDKDAVIEAMDGINLHHCRDLLPPVTEHDYHRSIVRLVKNGHVLLESLPFNHKPVDEKIVAAVYCINSCDRSLRATVVTKGTGGVQLEQSVSIGG